jgi:hypothetical protein
MDGPHVRKSSPSISQQRTNLVIFRAWPKAHLLRGAEKQGISIHQKRMRISSSSLKLYIEAMQTVQLLFVSCLHVSSVHWHASLDPSY